MWFISYWFWPVFSSLVWLAMLISMLVWWSEQGKPVYRTMEPGQKVAYISDVGAQDTMKPLFIAMGAVSVISFDLAFVLERYLRHTGRLVPNTSVWQKAYSLLSCIAAIAGGAGLILLAVFDVDGHSKLHNGFLVMFIGGYIVSAIFICAEYQRLGIHYKQNSILRYSFWIKLAFIIIEIALCIAFGVTKNRKRNIGAILEWVIAFIYFFYVLSFFIDFMPAVRTKGRQSKQTEMNMATMENGAGDGAADTNYFRGAPATNGHSNGYSNGYTNGHANGFTNGHTNGYTNGHAKPAQAPLSRNF